MPLQVWLLCCLCCVYVWRCYFPNRSFCFYEVCPFVSTRAHKLCIKNHEVASWCQRVHCFSPFWLASMALIDSDYYERYCVFIWTIIYFIFFKCQEKICVQIYQCTCGWHGWDYHKYSDFRLFLIFANWPSFKFVAILALFFLLFSQTIFL